MRNMSSPDESLVSDVQESRRRFLELVAELRPDLHRYCARITGSVSDGEDVVQEARGERVPAGWHLVPAWLDGREVLAAFRRRGDARPGYFVELRFAGGRVVAIQDFRYVPYVLAEAEVECLEGRPGAGG